MKNFRKQKSPVKKAIVILIIAIVLAGIYGGVSYTAKWWPFSVSTGNPVTESTNSDGNATKEGLIVPGENSSKTTDQVPVTTELTATITNLSQSNGYVSFVGTVNSVDTSGECSIILTNDNDKPVSRTVTAIIESGVVTCGPVQIPESEFTFLGKWLGTFRYYINGSQVVATKDITIK